MTSSVAVLDRSVNDKFSVENLKERKMGIKEIFILMSI